MNATQAENLRILIRHMETNVKRTLDMRRIRNPVCGTPACAWGEACMVPELQVHFGTLEARRVGVLPMEVFGHGTCLFGTSINGKADVSPLEWAIEARKALAEHGYTMDDDKPAPTFERFMERVREPVLNATEEAGAKLDGEATYR